MTPIPILRLPHTPAAWPPPARAHATDAGLDLRACLPDGIEVEIYTTGESSGRTQLVTGGRLYLRTGYRARIPTGWSLAIPDGFEGQVRARSGLALRNGYRVHPGTVDSGYRGEVSVIVVAGPMGFRIEHGDRIAQMVVAPVSLCGVVEVASLPESARAAGGFGSTG